MDRSQHVRYIPRNGGEEFFVLLGYVCLCYGVTKLCSELRTLSIVRENKHLQFLSWSRNSPHFMEPEGSLPPVQQPHIVPIMSQTDPIHALPSSFFKIHVNIFLPSTPTTSQLSLSFPFPYQRAVCISLPRTSHLPLFTYHSVEVYSR